ncbi:AAA family ATPase [Virgibacillus flavescens]|uniref:ATP-binding protein n=1 Tax=Virgibacillus flavescens TaxID=1611422 RepID=UPI003D331E23
MKFIRAKIYGFAKWHDYQIDFQPDDLHVIYGENESGKSSLQQFILFILFGLQPKKRALYRSKTSGKMGGSLTVYEESVGEYTIERLDEVRNGAAKCLLPNGVETDEVWLKNRLNGMNRQIYQSIYSFDALDLNTLKTLNEEDLGEVLLGVSLTGSIDIYAVEKRLESKINELFKPYGKKPVINQQLDYLDELTDKVHSFKSQEKKYNEKTADLDETKNKIAELEHTIREKNRKLLETEKLRQALPNLRKLNNHKNALKTYPKVIPFPENGIKRWEAVKEKILPLKSEHKILQKNLSEYKYKMDEIKNSLLDEMTYRELQRLLETRSTYSEQVKEINNLENKLKEQEISLKNEMNNIDTNLALEDLEGLSLTYHTENTWNQLNEETQKIQFEQEKLTQEEAVLLRQEKELSSSLGSYQEKQLSPVQVDELSNRITSYETTHNSKLVNKQTVNFEAFKHKKERTSFHLFIGSLLIGLIFSLIGFSIERTWSYGIALVLLVIGTVQWLVAKQSIKAMDQLMNHSFENDDAIPVTLEEKKEAESLLAIHDEATSKSKMMEDKLQTNNIEKIKWHERHEIIVQKAIRIDESIAQQRKLFPILESIELTNWPSFYHVLKSILKQKQEWVRNVEKLDNLKEESLSIPEKVTTFLNKKNWEIEDKATVSHFTFLVEQKKKHDDFKQQLVQYTTWKKAADEQISSVNQKLQTFQQELENLMKLAETETEDGFYQKHALLEDKKQAEAKEADTLEQLDMIFSKEKISELVAGTSLDNTQIEEEQKDVRGKLKLAEQELEEKRRQLASLQADLNNMESSEEHSQTMHRFHLENAELVKLIDRWAVLKSAKEMLAETKNNYRDKYMLRIMDQTSDFFSILTNNAYTHVFAPSMERLIQVESADRLRYSVNELSQGTRDQLYISLRLAISEVMSDSHNMPFIIDDAFVHFDDSRMEQMINLITAISANRQVVLFTCKKEIISNINKRNITHLTESIRKI